MSMRLNGAGVTMIRRLVNITMTGVASISASMSTLRIATIMIFSTLMIPCPTQTMTTWMSIQESTMTRTLDTIQLTM